MRSLRLSFVLCAIFVLNGFADWNPGDPAKWEQLPDPNGWDVKVDENNFVADDFQCTQSGPITDIHIWGSWLGDIVGQINNFQLRIYPDIPAAVSPTGYSIPGDSFLWSYQTFNYDPAHVVSRIYGDPSPQGFFDPVTQSLSPIGDHNLTWQYNIHIDEENQFVQEQGTIYWLEVHTITEGGISFGWKTSLDHWNDDSVYYDDVGLPPPHWGELFDPMQPGVSLDQAFTLVPEPSAVALALAAFLGVLGLRRLRK